MIKLQDAKLVRAEMLNVFSSAFPNLSNARTYPFLIELKEELRIPHFGWVWFPETLDIVINYDGNGIFGVMPRSEWKTKLKVPAKETQGYIGTFPVEVRYNYQLMFTSEEADEIYESTEE